MCADCSSVRAGCTGARAGGRATLGQVQVSWRCPGVPAGMALGKNPLARQRVCLNHRQQQPLTGTKPAVLQTVCTFSMDPVAL